MNESIPVGTLTMRDYLNRPLKDLMVHPEYSPEYLILAIDILYTPISQISINKNNKGE